MARWILPVGTMDQIDGADSPTPGEIAFEYNDGVTNAGSVVVYSDGEWKALTFGSVTISSEGLAADSIVITDESNGITAVDISNNEVLSRNSSGQLGSTKIQSVHVDDNTLTFNKIQTITPGNLLGAASDDFGGEITEIPIDSIKGTSVTASDTAPQDPEDNDLWFYCSSQSGEAVDGIEPPSSRLYIYLDGNWVDAAPPIVSRGEVGPQGMAGTDGTAGLSIGRVSSEGSTAGGDVILDFYNTEDTFINSVTIPRNAIDAIEFNKVTGSATVVSGEANYSLNSFTFEGIAPTIIAASHTVIYKGLVLIEGVDYSISPNNLTVTLTPTSVAEITTGTLYLTNTTEGASGISTIGKQTGTVEAMSSKATYTKDDFSNLTTDSISDDHTLVLEGLVLIEAVDYTFANDKLSVTLTSDTLDAIEQLETDDPSRTIYLYLINITS